MINIFRIVLLLVFWSGTISCIAANRITDINFEGIVRTDSAFLHRFLQCKVGMEPDSQMIAQDCQRLQNLPYIIQAQYRLDSVGDETALVFELVESWSLFPIVNFGGIKGNFWMQLGASDFNAFGKGIQIGGFYQLTDGRHGGQFYAKMPYIKGSKWGASVNALRWASTEPLFFGDNTVYYDYENYSIGGLASYEFQIDHELEAGASFFIEQYRKDERHEGETTPGPNSASIPKALFKAHHRYGRINYHFYHLDGWDVNQYAQAIYDFDYRNWFKIYWVDARYFKRLGQNQNLNLAIRCRAGISDNNDSPFSPFVLDSRENIRGSGNRIDRGTGVLVCNTELRYAFFDRKQLASQAVFFTDMGTWRKPGGELSDFADPKNIELFSGLGMRFIYKKVHNAIFRVDYGVDLMNPDRRGFVLGLGQYF